MIDYINNVVNGIQNLEDRFDFMLNNFKTVYILIILIYTACIFILISQYAINRKLDMILLPDKNKIEKLYASDNKLSKLLSDLVLSVLSIIFIIIVIFSIV